MLFIQLGQPQRLVAVQVLCQVRVRRLPHLRGFKNPTRVEFQAVNLGTRGLQEALDLLVYANVPRGTELSERLSQEATLFALRIDVAEEIARLRSHLQEPRAILEGKPAQPAGGKRQGSAGGSAGKRLDFLIQELQREANTLGSKSAAIELTAISVEMKVAVEQMREQVQNLE